MFPATERRGRTIRLLLADDHPIVRDGLRSSFEGVQHIAIVGEAATGEEAVRLTSELQPDVVLMDISMPEMGGLEAARLIRERHPLIKVVVLTVHDSKEYIVQILRAGAAGYVRKDASAAALRCAIESAADGQEFVSPSLSALALANYVEQTTTQNAVSQVLSSREREVLGLIASGYSNKQIARELGISLRTAETHRAHIIEKLGIRSTAELTKFAIRAGISELEPRD